MSSNGKKSTYRGNKPFDKNYKKQKAMASSSTSSNSSSNSSYTIDTPGIRPPNSSLIFNGGNGVQWILARDKLQDKMRNDGCQELTERLATWVPTFDGNGVVNNIMEYKNKYERVNR